MKNMLICILCMGATVTPLLLSKNISYDILDDKSLTDLCSLVFNSICEKKVPFPVYTAVLNVKYSKIWRKMKTLLTWYSAVHAVQTLHTEGMYPHHIQRIQHLEPADMCNQLQLCRWIHSNPDMILDILFTDDAHCTHDGFNKTKLPFMGS